VKNERHDILHFKQPFTDGPGKQMNFLQSTQRTSMNAIVRSGLLLLATFALWNCGEGNGSHGADPGDPRPPIQFVVKVAAIDSATSERLDGVRVAEFTRELRFEQILSGDSIVPFNLPGYYLVFDVTTDSSWWEPWTAWLWYEAYYPQIAAPTYSRYVAYKPGYKVWRWSLERDTIYNSVRYPGYDSLCIRLVKK
jgi:hypothetical protein